MGLKENMKMVKAVRKHQKGEYDEAFKLYEELYDSRVVSARYLIYYATMLLKKGGEENYKKAKEVLLVAQKAPDLTPQHRVNLFTDYATAEYKLGDMEAALRHMETIAQKNKTGDVYSVLGYLYIEAGDVEKALAFNTEALEYDDEDPVVLDNMGQLYYRLLNDKVKAKEYFDRAIAEKPNQIDTLYFLSRYDLEKGDKAAAKEKLEKAYEGRFSPLNYVTKEIVAEEIKKLG